MTDFNNDMQHLWEGKEKLPPGKKRAAVVIGRFNPPTKGHYALVNHVKSFIKNHKKLELEAFPVVVVIAGSKSDSDKKKNPLTGEDRIKFMKASGHVNGVHFFTAKTAFEAFDVLRKNDFEPIAVAAGQDRIDDYVRILDKYFTDEDDNPVKHHPIELPRKESAVDSDEGAEKSRVKILDRMKEEGTSPDIDEISASLARLAVDLGYEEEFAKIVHLEHKPALAKKMFKKIKEAMKE